MKRVLQCLPPTLTPGYQCHLFLIKKLYVITGCQRIMQSSIYKFPSKTSVFEKRKVMQRLIFSVYKRGPLKLLAERIITNAVLELKMTVLILTDANDIIYKTSTLAYTLIISAD